MIFLATIFGALTVCPTT